MGDTRQDGLTVGGVDPRILRHEEERTRERVREHMIDASLQRRLAEKFGSALRSVADLTAADIQPDQALERIRALVVNALRGTPWEVFK